MKLIFDHTDYKNIWLHFRGFKVFESDCIQINENLGRIFNLHNILIRLNYD